MTVTLDASPATVLRLLRGSIVAARTAYPEVLHLEVEDPAGRVWRLATQDAEYSPSDPNELVGQMIEGAEIDERTGALQLRLGGESSLLVRPASQDAKDDPPNWELITPDGLALEFGPGVRWQIADAGAPPSRH